MATYLVFGLLALLLGGLIVAVVRLARRQGRTEAAREASENARETEHAATDAINRRAADRGSVLDWVRRGGRRS